LVFIFQILVSLRLSLLFALTCLTGFLAPPFMAGLQC
jgi:hypothetical protein